MKNLGILALVLALVAGAAWLPRGAGRGAPGGSTQESRAVSEDMARAATLREPGAVLPASELAEFQREEVEAATAPAPQERARGAGLGVRVLARESGRPIAGVHVLLTSAHGRAGWLGQVPGRTLEGGVGVACPCPMTDAEGRVELEARVGEESTLLVNLLENVHARRMELDVPPFAVGERRELELMLETRDDLRWFGRVIDDATDAPLAGAEVEWGGRERRRAVSAADGMLVLDFASWQASEVEIALAGYLPTSLALVRGHESAELAQPVRLVRPAALGVRVRDALGAPRAQVRVELEELDPSVEPELSALPVGRVTDADGTCAFEGLAPRVRLSVAVRAGLGRTRRQEVLLAPGERRALEFELESGCRVLGQAVDEEGRPLAGLDLWRLAVDGFPALRELLHEHAVVDKARTDERGRFVFEQVPAGDWWIGPAPSLGVARVSPLATRVVVLPGEARQELTLVCAAALYIQGRVLSPEGRGTPGVVTAWKTGTRFVTGSRNDGRFVVGPLTSGDWLLQARDSRDSVGIAAPSTVVRAEVGRSDVLLALRSGSILAGSVLDERGRRVPGAEVCLSPDEHGRAASATTDEYGSFVLGAQAPGEYHLWARSGASVATLGPVEVDAGRATERVELRLQAGAELRFRLASSAPPGLDACVSWDGVPCLVAELLPGAELWRTLPPGPAVVRLVRRKAEGGLAVLEERSLTLRVGETALVELPGADAGR